MGFLKKFFGNRKPSHDTNRNSGNLSEKKGDPASEPLPGFLVKPNDPISNMMYGAQLTPVADRRCGYQIEINESYQNRQPEVRSRSGQFPIDETHIYSKPDVPSWYAVSTMKTPMVRTSPLASSVQAPYNMAKLFNEPSILIPLPEGRSFDGYQSIRLMNLGSFEAFTRQKGLDESMVFCHVFQLGGQVYKDYILCARKGDFGWKLECFIQSQNNNPEIQAVDFVPPGFLFGGFRPVD